MEGVLMGSAFIAFAMGETAAAHCLGALAEAF
jgi:hypothetical protein